MAEGWARAESLELFAPGAAGDTELLDFWARMLRSGISPSTMRTIGEMYVSLDIRSLLPGVSSPTLVMWRDGDRLIPPALSRVVADGIPGARSVESPV